MRSIGGIGGKSSEEVAGDVGDVAIGGDGVGIAAADDDDHFFEHGSFAVGDAGDGEAIALLAGELHGAAFENESLEAHGGEGIADGGYRLLDILSGGEVGIGELGVVCVDGGEAVILGGEEVVELERGRRGLRVAAIAGDCFAGEAVELGDLLVGIEGPVG